MHCRANAQHRDHSSRHRGTDAPTDLQLAASGRQTHQSGRGAATSAGLVKPRSMTYHADLQCAVYVFKWPTY